MNLEDIKKSCEAIAIAGGKIEPEIIAAILICDEINDLRNTIANYGDLLYDYLRSTR